MWQNTMHCRRRPVRRRFRLGERDARSSGDKPDIPSPTRRHGECFAKWKGAEIQILGACDRSSQCCQGGGDLQPYSRLLDAGLETARE